jgi:membrane associated rhomboid family serine protease
MVRVKLGTIFALAGLAVLVQEWIRGELGHPLEPDYGRRLFYAIYVGIAICALIFLVMGVLNAGLRTIANDWRWFQLP